MLDPPGLPPFTNPAANVPAPLEFHLAFVLGLSVDQLVPSYVSVAVDPPGPGLGELIPPAATAAV